MAIADGKERIKITLPLEVLELLENLTWLNKEKTKSDFIMKLILEEGRKLELNENSK